MYPILFKWGPFTFYAYGLMLALAFIACTIVARREAKYRGLDPDIVYDLVILSAVGGIIGGRLLYVAANWLEFLLDPWSIFAIQNGGLIFYGGLMGGAVTLLSYLWWKRLPLGQIADLVALVLPLGSAIGRLGCFLNGCCYGLITHVPWGIVFPGLAPLDFPRHPTQLYDALYNLLLFALLWFLRHRLLYAGMLFWTFLAFYSSARFGVEFLRENTLFFWGLSLSQIISIVAFSISIIGLVVTCYYNRRYESETDAEQETGSLQTTKKSRA